jgi:hypothetical protein
MTFPSRVRSAALFVAKPIVAERVLTACAIASFAVAISDVATGGFSVQILGVRISSWEVYKPMRNGLLCALVGAWLHDRTAPAGGTTWDQLRRASFALTFAFAAAWSVLAIRYTSRAVGGSDTYGYVSQAALWTSGHLTVHDRLAELAPLLGRSVAPLGYQLARLPCVIVPKYSPVLPLVMALAMKVSGRPNSVYYIVPVAAGLAIWLTYVLGARLAGRAAGFLAAVVCGLSPIFVFQSLHAMSDVPATMWWLLAWTLAWAPGRWLPIAAGLAASMAVLTRPNLVPLTAIVAALVALERPRLIRIAAFSAGLVPSCVMIAALNTHFYGSPLNSGYGSLSFLYSWQNLGPNLRNYGAWFFDLHSPAVLAAVAAPWVVRSKRAWLMLAFSAGVLLSYLFYFVYDSWIYLRFLLPAIPLFFVLAAAVAHRFVERLPARLRGAAFLLILALLCWHELRAQHFDLFEEGQSEKRFAIVGEFLGRTLPPDAVVLSLDESGSIRMYGHRETLRWDLVPEDRLDHTLAVLRAHEFVPYILLEPWEVTWFRSQFARASVFGRVDWPPAIEVRGPVAARLYSIDDRARFLAGEEIHPLVLSVR